ncbi:thioredoxin [Mesorhizobium sp. J18]|uniref:thioredoxin n=1 Tax=Mesorhizobium sp. J18 TaxID=935263 RepID=UPI0011992908|nr:thioredoxin [Mesorhizobium sp. J18]TWG97890.1 thioredoxin [Mesorhizobium sp. J18]
MSNQDNPYAIGGGQYVASAETGGKPATAGFSLGGAEAAAAPAPIKDTTTASFAADVIEESRKQPVLVDFWAPWCGPCKQLAPALEKVVAEAGGRVRLVKMNIDDHPAIAGQLGIQSIPAVIAFKNGQPVDGFMGAIPESQIREFVNRVAGDSGKDEIAEAIAAAAQARQEGDDQTAAQIYSAILQQAPDNVDALAGLADILFEAGQADRAREILDRAPEAGRDAAPIAAVRAKLALAEQVAGLGDAKELEARLAANSKDHQARFDLALIQNARGMREEAADNLLAIIKADRAWQDDAARTQLLKFFDAWGQADEATLAARRKLSSILFS